MVAKQIRKIDGFAPGLTGNEMAKKMPMADESGFGADKKRRTKQKSLAIWANIEPILRQLMDNNNGALPSESWMRKNGYSAISSAIYRHHRGFQAVQEKLGVKAQLLRGERSYRHWVNLEPVLKKIIAENNNDLPPVGWFQKNGYGGILAAICTSHRGMRAVRDRLGLSQIYRAGKDSYQIWSNLESILRVIVQVNNGILPCSNWFDRHGYIAERHAIKKYYGGFPAVREKLRTQGILKKQPSSTEIFQELKDAMGSEPLSQ